MNKGRILFLPFIIFQISHLKFRIILFPLQNYDAMEKKYSLTISWGGLVFFVMYTLNSEVNSVLSSILL